MEVSKPGELKKPRQKWKPALSYKSMAEFGANTVQNFTTGQGRYLLALLLFINPGDRDMLGMRLKETICIYIFLNT